MQQPLRHRVRNLEENIITISGPALATSGIIAGLDVLTNNVLARYAPTVGIVMGVVWALCLMLTLDFQVLTLGVKARRIYSNPNKQGAQKFAEVILCVIIALALGYVSLQMGSIFARMLGTSLTMDQAQVQLGINPIALIYERSAMVMLLIFMSGWLRDESSDQDAVPVSVAAPQPQAPDLATIIETLDERYNQRMQATVEAITQTMTRVVIEQVTTTVQQALPPAPDRLIAEPVPTIIASGNDDQAGDTRDRIQAILVETPGLSSRKIAERLGDVSHTTVATHLKALKIESEIR